MNIQRKLSNKQVVNELVKAGVCRKVAKATCSFIDLSKLTDVIRIIRDGDLFICMLNADTNFPILDEIIILIEKDVYPKLRTLKFENIIKDLKDEAADREHAKGKLVFFAETKIKCLYAIGRIKNESLDQLVVGMQEAVNAYK